ncbi:F420-non-reducing hydrogenase small subunit [Dehalogenimonas formicexedens]|uniref:F420-non-reducing hydrogenase small subunit n=1 Tax=Dehalogenimonas formicexedens TaxID=1839801 RepID=A0A1P8F722_9CHLR|nr:methyl viologen-reducing hydrogenase [Dehalogenimonas formicexedens]APV44279.1 F420-non-reducing hydrogenase small subunit [Dehalogenimonas formicexedens]
MVRVAEEWFAVCGGCEVSILDIGEPLLDLLPSLEFVHMPVLMDHKLFGQTGEKKHMEIPEADVGIVTGSIRNQENKELAEEMRRKCKIIISLGSCANFGGIPALGNMYNNGDIFDIAYRKTASTEAGDNPSQGLPALTDRVYSVNEVIKVDVSIPGCPPTPEWIAGALTALLQGKSFSLPERSVCDDCPTVREKKAKVAIRRPLQAPEFTPGRYDNMRCMNEQGILCLGPATRTGCGGSEKTPRCIKAYMPCRGCFGPIRAGANPMVDMMGALSSVGLDPKQIEDRMATFNRFIGAGRLRPMPTR